jgi:hypothetical protein
VTAEGAGAAAASLAAGVSDAGVSAQALADKAASARAVTSDFLIGFMEFSILSFLSFAATALTVVLPKLRRSQCRLIPVLRLF